VSGAVVLIVVIDIAGGNGVEQRIHVSTITSLDRVNSRSNDGLKSSDRAGLIILDRHGHRHGQGQGKDLNILVPADFETRPGDI